MTAPESVAARAAKLYPNERQRAAYVAGVRAREAGAPFEPPHSAVGWGAGYRNAWMRGYREARDGLVAAPEGGFP